MNSRNRAESYVGVSGVGLAGQQEILRVHTEMNGLDQSRRLLIGVKAVHKSQWLDTQNKYGDDWYPVGDNIKRVLDNDTDTFNVAQMFFDPETLAEDQDYPFEFIDKVVERLGLPLDGIQIDMLPFHKGPEDFRELWSLINSYNLDRLIQCHAYAMRFGPKKAIEMLKRAVPDPEYVLFDASHGTGKELDVEALLPFLDAAANDPDLRGIGLAGGLDAEVVERHLPRVVAEFPQASWDAEGKLHKTDSGRLQMGTTLDYLDASARVLK